MGSFQREESRNTEGRVHAPGVEITMPSAGGSILYGMGPDGNLHHINDVERGEACNCVCPDPNCGQTLIARKGEKKSHHFAHKRGTCEWAAEYVISAVAADIVQRAGAIVFPKLAFKDAFTGSDETIAEGQSVRISSAQLVQESGRGNPDLLITRKTSTGEVREFLVLFSLVHGVSHKQREAVRQTGRDSFVVDLNYLMRLRKEDLGRHFDREQILLGFQDPQFLFRILTQGEGRCMRWLFNARRAKAEAENRARHNEWLAEQEAKRKAAEEARRKREEEMRREAERKRRETAAERERQAAEAARRAEEEEQARKAALEAEREEISRRLDQQESRVEDSLGNRWIRCERCGKESTTDDFMMYGGDGRINLGLCYDCGRKQR